jgi:hypothetical protein
VVSGRRYISMKRIWKIIGLSVIAAAVIFSGYVIVNDMIKEYDDRQRKVDFIPPALAATGELLEINGYEITIKVSKLEGRDDYYKVGDTISGKLNKYDFYYEKHPFKVGDVVYVISDNRTNDDGTIEFDYIRVEEWMNETKPVETIPAETTLAPKEDEVPVQTGGDNSEPVEIKAKYIFYNGKLYTFSNEHFLQRTEKDFLEKWPDYKHIGYVVKEDNYTIPNGEFEACGLKEGSKVYINPYDDKYIVVYDEIFWKMRKR